MAARWTIRNYNAFVREVQRKEGVSRDVARAVYRSVREHLGQSLRGVDVVRHPRIVHKAIPGAKISAGKRAKERERLKKITPPIVGERVRIREVRTVAQWEAIYIRTYDFGKWHGRLDYGRRKR